MIVFITVTDFRNHLVRANTILRTVKALHRSFRGFIGHSVGFCRLPWGGFSCTNLSFFNLLNLELKLLDTLVSRVDFSDVGMLSVTDLIQLCNQLSVLFSPLLNTFLVKFHDELGLLSELSHHFL